MGGSVSRHALSPHEKHLGQLCGPISIPIGDPFWSNLGHFPVQLSSLDPREVLRVMEPYCQQLIVNSRKTQNLQTLIQRLLGVIYNAQEDEQHRAAANGICFLKLLFKCLLEKLPGPDFLSFMDGVSFTSPPLHEHRPGKVKLLAGAYVRSCADPNGSLVRLVRGLVSVAMQSTSYLLLVETLQCLLVGCSTQLYVEYVTWGGGVHPVLEILMEEREAGPLMIQRLLQWYIERSSPPSGAKIFREVPSGEQPSVFKFVRTAAVSVMWLPVTAYKYLVGAGDASSYSPLADAAQHLLFVLVHHVPYTATSVNPYRSALRSLHDVTFVGGVTSQEPRVQHLPSIAFSDLYRRLAKSLDDERGTLMLYTLVQCVHPFRDYALVRSDVETLLMPILKQVYQVSKGSQSQLYLLSIILLIFSQDASFSQDVHTVWMSGPDWFKERSLGKLTVGSFMILLLLRTAQANLLTGQDLYLHTNTVAALANMTSTSLKLHSFAAQRFLSLVSLLTRKYKKALAVGGLTGEKDFEFRLQFYNDFLTMLLEVLNSVLLPKPESNLNLMYAALQKQQLFDEVAQLSPEYAELVETLQHMMQHFNGEIDQAKAEGVNAVWSVADVLAVVQRAAPVWAASHPQLPPQLRFSYEEEQSAEQFFVPVVWTLIVSFSGLPWSPESISLFSPQTPTASALDSDDFAPEGLWTSTSNGTQESQQRDAFLKSCLVKDLRVECRNRGISPAGSRGTLVEKLNASMTANGETAFGRANVSDASLAAERSVNNYLRPEGQNVGNFVTDRSSSRVLAPPGGKSSVNFFGATAPADVVHDQTRRSMSPPAAPKTEPTVQQRAEEKPQRPPLAPRGGLSLSQNDYPPAADDVGERSSSNNYRRPGDRQNVGNHITGRNSSRVSAPPGGQSSITFG